MTRKGQRERDRQLREQRKHGRRVKQERDKQVSAEFGESGHRSCGRKSRYSTQAEAELKASTLKLYGVPTLRAYECRYCGGWHLTKQPLMSEVVRKTIEESRDMSTTYKVHEKTRMAAAINVRIGMSVADTARCLHIPEAVVERSIAEFAHLSDEELMGKDAQPEPEPVSQASDRYFIIMSDAGTPVTLMTDEALAKKVAKAMSTAMKKVGGPKLYVTSVEPWDAK